MNNKANITFMCLENIQNNILCSVSYTSVMKSHYCKSAVENYDRVQLRLYVEY